jgi:sulfur carrier protein
MLIQVNGQPHELEPGATVATAMAALEVTPDSRGIAVAVDGEVVPRGAWELTLLAEGTQVEVVVAVQGG